jgi:hypothetical protein
LLYRGARGTPADKEKGRKIIQSLANPSRHIGLGAAQITLAGILARDDKNYEAAREMYEKAGRNGQQNAWIELGKIYI